MARKRKAVTRIPPVAPVARLPGPVQMKARAVVDYERDRDGSGPSSSDSQDDPFTADDESHFPGRDAMESTADNNSAMTGGKDKSTKTKPMSDMDFQNLVQTACANASSYDQTQIQPDRLRNRRFYNGDLSEDLPPNEDGSSVVSRDVSDTIHAVIPSLIRIFFSTDNVVEFVPKGPEDEAMAEQATDYINYLWRANMGVTGFYDLAFDSMLAKVGVLTWWWDTSTRVEEFDATGLTPAEFGMILQPMGKDEEIKLVSFDQYPATAEDIVPSETNPQPTIQPGESLTDCRIRRITKQKRLRFAAIPPEERLIDPVAKEFDPTLRKMRYWGHRTLKTVGELVDMGYKREYVLAHATGDEDDVGNSIERALRQPAQIDPSEEDLPSLDQKQVYYVTLYIRCDRDGDGHQEIVKACCIGNAYVVAHEETVDWVPAAEFASIRQPHVATGRCVADNLIDIQIIKSGLQRNVMESLPHSIYPRLIVVEDNVNMDDVVNTAPGQPVRVKNQGDVQPMVVPFVGQPALDVIQYYDSVKESRTGVSPAAQGLDPDALQSTPAVAAASMITLAQTQIEMTARMLAETGFKTMAKALLREIVKNQNQPDQIKLRGTWVEMDPRPWNVEMDVIVHSGLGRGSDQSKLATLQLITQKQEQAIGQGGPDNPLVTLKQYRDTLAQMIEIGGLPNADKYFNPNPQPPQPQPPPPPVQLLVAQEKEKTATAKNQNDFQLKNWEFEADVFFRCLDACAKLGIPPQMLPAQQVIDAIRGPGPLPVEQAPVYPVAPPAPALSHVEPPSGNFIVPQSHRGGMADALARLHGGAPPTQ